MFYRDTPQFQRVLQAALQLKWQERKGQDESFSDEKMIAEAHLECSKSTLHRFRQAGKYLNKSDAEKLWRHLDQQDMIDKAVKFGTLKKQNLYSTQEVASGMHCFYNVDQLINKEYGDEGVRGAFVCYKRSFRRRGYVVKSLMNIKPINGVYFSVEDRQVVSGVYEVDRKPIVEESEGFGFVKSDRLWFFMRDKETEQPRVFCFDKKKLFSPERAPVTNRISTMDGYVLEGAIGNVSGAFPFRVTLIEQRTDLDIWKEQGINDDIEEHLDVYPVVPTLRNFEDLKKRKPILVHPEVIEYLYKRATSSFDAGADDNEG